jgi:hypothetical protein
MIPKLPEKSKASNSLLKKILFRGSGRESVQMFGQFPSKLEPTHAGCYFFDGLLTPSTPVS